MSNLRSSRWLLPALASVGLLSAACGGAVAAGPSAPGGASDRDADGVADAEDACPDLRGIRTGDPRNNGCPPDRDHDGILDAEDACPDAPGLRTNDPKTTGCPRGGEAQPEGRTRS